VKLVEQLLELAKLDARHVAMSPEPFQLAELVHDVVLKFALSARRMGVTLQVEPPQGTPLVLGDIALIERVVDNLLDNALRYAGPGGGVTVRMSSRHQAMRVEVHDTGPGIPESERIHVFDRFYRGDKSRSSESGHAGLGLSIARSILELHGQSIDLVSAAGQGTTFFFELPVVAAHAPATESASLLSRPGAATG
jgi:signal transduction histidine kinase